MHPSPARRPHHTSAHTHAHIHIETIQHASRLHRCPSSGILQPLILTPPHPQPWSHWWVTVPPPSRPSQMSPHAVSAGGAVLTPYRAAPGPAPLPTGHTYLGFGQLPSHPDDSYWRGRTVALRSLLSRASTFPFVKWGDTESTLQKLRNCHSHRHRGPAGPNLWVN